METQSNDDYVLIPSGLEGICDWKYTLQKRRVEELLSRDIPQDEACLLKNGRFTCLVCSYRPVLDTVDMLCVHRSGKKHKYCAEQFFRKKRELHRLVEKRRQKDSIRGNQTEPALPEAPLLRATKTAAQNALLRYAPYNSVSSGAQSGKNEREDFKTIRSENKGFFEFTRNVLTNNAPRKKGDIPPINPPYEGSSSKRDIRSSAVSVTGSSYLGGVTKKRVTDGDVLDSLDELSSVGGHRRLPTVSPMRKPSTGKRYCGATIAPHTSCENTHRGDPWQQPPAEHSGDDFTVKPYVSKRKRMRDSAALSAESDTRSEDISNDWEPITEFPLRRIVSDGGSPDSERERMEGSVALHAESDTHSEDSLTPGETSSCQNNESNDWEPKTEFPLQRTVSDDGSPDRECPGDSRIQASQSRLVVVRYGSGKRTPGGVGEELTGVLRDQSRLDRDQREMELVYSEDSERGVGSRLGTVETPSNYGGDRLETAEALPFFGGERLESARDTPGQSHSGRMVKGRLNTAVTSQPCREQYRGAIQIRGDRTHHPLNTCWQSEYHFSGIVMDPGRLAPHKSACTESTTTKPGLRLDTHDGDGIQQGEKMENMGELGQYREGQEDTRTSYPCSMESRRNPGTRVGQDLHGDGTDCSNLMLSTYSRGGPPVRFTLLGPEGRHCGVSSKETREPSATATGGHAASTTNQDQKMGSNNTKGELQRDAVKERQKAKPLTRYSEERRMELQKHLELKSSGWVHDPSGRWVKDENVEFDSDEEELD